MEPGDTQDQLLQATAKAIVAAVTAAVDLEPASRTLSLRVPGGPVVGKQITIDAVEKGGAMNLCRISLLNPDLAPAGEVACMEYEHDKQTKFGVQRVYSIQSVRRQHAQLVLMDNFLAETQKDVREQDFRAIESESYAQGTVLATLAEWTHYRAWQLQEARKK
jgi:hypothetical protein